MRFRVFVVAALAMSVAPAYGAIVVNANSFSLNAGATLNGYSMPNPFLVQDAAYTSVSATDYVGTKSTAVTSPPGYPSASASNSLSGTFHSALPTTGQIDSTFSTTQSATTVCSSGCVYGGAHAGASTYTNFTIDEAYLYEISSSASFVPATNWNAYLTTGLVDTATSEFVGREVREQFGANPLSVTSEFLTGILQPGQYYFVAQGTVSLSTLSAADLSGEWSGHLKLTAVPLPAAAWLMVSGLGGIAAFARRRREARRFAA